MANPLSQLDEAGDAVRQVIRAYHGSPYDFDRFDASKIGTGEGAQAYGHGLYFAQNPKVAEEYRKSVPAWPQYESPEQMAADYLFVHKTPEDALRVMREHGSWQGSRVRRQMYQDAVRILGDGRPVAPREFPFADRPPRTYEVEIAHPEAALLDWDGPIGPDVAARLTPAMRASLERGVRERLDSGMMQWPYVQERHADSVLAMQDDPALAPGVALYEGLAADYAPSSASRKLLEAGIPGLRYLDANSRHWGQGTRNYVMFPGTEDSIRILRKYGLLAPIAAGAASSMPPDENP